MCACACLPAQKSACVRAFDTPTVWLWCVQLETGGDGAAFQAVLDDMTSAMKLYGQVRPMTV